MKSGLRAVRAMTGVAWAALAMPLYAQEAAPVAPATDAAVSSETALSGEIVVTAQRRAQNLQDVGIAITAFSGNQLRALNVQDSTQLADFSPGVHIGGSIAGQNSQYTIRGVTQNDFNDIVEAPNAVYLDDGYIAIGQGQTFALFDIDRVEVLKGPQGTLFGRNATGGLIRYISRKPSLSAVEGFIDLSYGLYDSVGTPGQFRGEAALSVPLGETVAARGAILWNKRDDLLRNDYPNGAVGGSPGAGAGANMGDDDTLAARLTTLFKPTDTFSLTLSGNYARSKLSTGAYQNKSTIAQFDENGELVNAFNTAPGETRASIAADGSDFGSDVDNNGVFGDSFGRPVPGADFFGYLDPDGKDFRTSGDFAFSNQNRVKTWGLNLTAEVELSDSVTLSSVSDYKNFYKLLFIDVDAGPGNQSANYAGVDAWTFSQEVRLSGKIDDLNWVAGGYYLKIHNRSINGLKFPVGSVVPGAPYDLGSDALLKTDSYSAFGQIDWRFAPRLNLILGGRIIREKKDYDFIQAIYATPDSRDAQVGAPQVIGPVFNPAPSPYTDKSGKTLWAGKAQIEFRPDDSLLLYAGINRGVKAGSYNAQLAGGLATPVSAIPYKAETLTSYEGGFKYSFPDGRTRLNANAYYYDYKDYQAFLFSGVSGIVINADAETYGIEGEFATSPMTGLDLGLSAAWFKATVKDVPLRVDGPISRDVQPTFAPRLSATAYARYEWDALGGKVSVGANAAYSSSYYYNLRNFDADKFSRYLMVDANIGWRRDNWSVTGAIRNLTDARAGIIGFGLATFCGCNEVSYKPPRFFQLTTRYTF